MTSQSVAAASPGVDRKDSAFIPIALLALLLSVVAHDFVATRRVHRATWIGMAVIIAGTVVQQAIAASEFGRAFVRLLG
jgi:hypothetical protein